MSNLPGSATQTLCFEVVMRSSLLLLLVVGFISCESWIAAADIEAPPIQYSTTAPDDAIAALSKKIADGTVALPRDDEHGYLRSLLRHLDIPLSSQVLVFSRTSLQRSRIGPKTPRALYFNDDVTVGFCLRGDVLEIAAADPKLGTTFYTVDQNPAEKGAITRQTNRCLLCHSSSANQGMPGHLISSVTADRTGEPLSSRGRVDHTTPFSLRWGGWYVTGTSGKQTHLGNQFFERQGATNMTDGVNVTNLKPFFTVANYLTPHSDLVALMVLEHQTEGHNRLTRANLLTRMALAEEEELNRARPQPLKDRDPYIIRRIEQACEPLVEYLLFCGEAPLRETVAGTSAFATEFAARGPFDAKRRSLREFDLQTRLFRYPLSYLIYSRSLEGLPPDAKSRVYQRLGDVLTERDRSPKFAHLSATDRRAILEILRETTKGKLPF